MPQTRGLIQNEEGETFFHLGKNCPAKAERAHNNTCGETDGKLKPCSTVTQDTSPSFNSQAGLGEIKCLYEQRYCSVRGGWKSGREREREYERVTEKKSERRESLQRQRNG